MLSSFIFYSNASIKSIFCLAQILHEIVHEPNAFFADGEGKDPSILSSRKAYSLNETLQIEMKEKEDENELNNTATTTL